MLHHDIYLLLYRNTRTDVSHERSDSMNIYVYILSKHAVLIVVYIYSCIDSCIDTHVKLHMIKQIFNDNKKNS